MLKLGEVAHDIIGVQYRQMVKYEKKVLADKDPEPLHQMRVGSRRLRTALQVFAPVLLLPKQAQIKALGSIAIVLGKLRDLDVQIANLQQRYRPQLPAKEQGSLDQVLQNLAQRRRHAFAGTSDILRGSSYTALKGAYKTWLHQPQFMPLAQMPLQILLPDLLEPLLSSLLMHPGWLVSLKSLSDTQALILHDLRKACKRVRYQAEFFTVYYGPTFQTWLLEVKELQENLGRLQDTQVLMSLLEDELPKRTELPGLRALMQQEQQAALANWEDLRQKYLDTTFRYGLHQMLLAPESIAPQAPEQSPLPIVSIG